jgi:hypothetical protein
MSTHLSEEEIDRFLAGRLEPAGRKRVLQHLTAGCGLCSRRLVGQAPGRLLEEAAESRRGRASRDPLRDRAVAVAAERDALWRPDDQKLKRSLELLDAHPQGYDGLTFRQVQALHGAALAEALLQRSWESRFRDSRGMRWLAYNALKVAESLRPGEHAPAALSDLQARAWAGLANAYKINDEYAEAEAALQRARGLLRRGSGDPRILIGVGWIESSLRGYQRRLVEARELIAANYRLSARIGDRHLMGGSLIARSSLSQYESSPRREIALLTRALTLIDVDRDPQLALSGRQGLVAVLLDNRRYREASRLLLREDLRRQLSTPYVRWSEGRLLAGIGQTAKAETALLSTREQFVEQGRLSMAALVEMDLIPVLLRQGKFGAARKAALESYTVLQSLGIHGDAAKARLYLR